LIVEGIYALHERIRPFLDLKIAISGGVHADLVSRVFRDIQRTGQQMQEIMQQITETVGLHRACLHRSTTSRRAAPLRVFRVSLVSVCLAVLRLLS
jgi:uridine kinase